MPYFSNFKMDLAWKEMHSSILAKMFLWKGVLKICSKFKGEHASESLISKKFDFHFQIIILHRCAPVNLLHTSRTLFHKNTFEKLLLWKECCHTWNQQHRCSETVKFSAKGKISHKAKILYVLNQNYLTLYFYILDYIFKLKKL